MNDSFGLLEYNQDAYELSGPKNARYLDALIERIEEVE